MPAGSSPIRVLFVETGTGGGGSFHSLRQIVEHIDRSVVLPTVVFFSRTDHQRAFEKLGVRVHTLVDPLLSRQVGTLGKQLAQLTIDLPRRLGCDAIARAMEHLIHLPAARALRRIATEARIDLIHTNTQIGRDIFAARAATRLGIPCVSYLRSIPGASQLRSDIAHQANLLVNRFVTNSDWMRDAWSDAGIDRERVTVIHHGIAPETVVPADLHRLLGIEDRATRFVGCVGTSRPTRRYDLLVRGFALAAKQDGRVMLLIVGGGFARRRQRLVALARSLKIEPQIRWIPRVSDAKPLIAGLDVLVMPYQVEPFGRVLLEAWVCGTPVIATRLGTIDQLVADDEEGLLVEFGNVSALGSAIHRALWDEPLRERLVTGGAAAVRSRYHIECQLEKLKLIYRQAIDRKRAVDQSDCFRPTSQR